MERKWTGSIPDPQEHPLLSRTSVYFYFEAESGKVVSRVEDHASYSAAMTFISEPGTFAGPDHLAKAKAHVEKAWAEKDAAIADPAPIAEQQKRVEDQRQRFKLELRVGGIGRDE